MPQLSRKLTDPQATKSTVSKRAPDCANGKLTDDEERANGVQHGTA
jgi:hypothetical protein